MRKSTRDISNVYQQFSRHFFGDLTVADRQELCLKALAVMTLNPNVVPNFSLQSGIDHIMGMIDKAEHEYPEIFVNAGRLKLSDRRHDTFLHKVMTHIGTHSIQTGLSHDKKKAIILDILTEGKPRPARHEIVFVDSVYQLCRELMNDVNGDVYLPTDAHLYHSIQLSTPNQHIFVENLHTNPNAVWVKFILGHITYQTADPVISPSYTQDGKVKIFAKGFLAEPWGERCQAKEMNTARFEVGGNNYQNYLLQHLFLQTSDLALAFVPQNSLTSNVSGELKMREWLVKRGHLRAVVALPSVMVKSTALPCSLMIFDLTHRYDSIRFVSLQNSPFVQDKKIVDIAKLVQSIYTTTNEWIVSMDHATLAEHNYVLDPERYVLSAESKQAVATLKKHKTAKLYEIADIIRPSLIAYQDDDGEKLWEVQGGDLPSYGYIDSVSKETYADPKDKRRLQSAMVQDGDIIMTMRGSTGKVGLIRQTLIDDLDAPLLVGKTCVIIRPKAGQDAIALYMQLHSTFAQNRLSLLSVNSTIAGLSVRDIENFDIALLSKDDEQTLINNFHQQCMIQDELIQKQQQLKQLSDDFWG